MLVGLGARPDHTSLASLLLDCHVRIRTFLALASAVTRGNPPDADVRDACRRARTYFAEALPLHMRDEEESLLPRLRGREAALDLALAAMAAEHGDERPVVAALVETLDVLGGEPANALARMRLAGLVAQLEASMRAHLEAEERVVFPAIERWLDDAAQRVVVGELRARRLGRS